MSTSFVLFLLTGGGPHPFLGGYETNDRRVGPGLDSAVRSTHIVPLPRPWPPAVASIYAICNRRAVAAPSQAGK